MLPHISTMCACRIFPHKLPFSKALLIILIFFVFLFESYAFSALTLLVGRQEGHLACKITEWWGFGMVICLERGTDLHTAQLMPLPLTVSCFSEIQIGFAFLVPAHPVVPEKGPLKCVYVFIHHEYSPPRIEGNLVIISKCDLVIKLE